MFNMFFQSKIDVCVFNETKAGGNDPPLSLLYNKIGQLLPTFKIQNELGSFP
jgi:hypothetical protein